MGEATLPPMRNPGWPSRGACQACGCQETAHQAATEPRGRQDGSVELRFVARGACIARECDKGCVAYVPAKR